MTLAGYDKSTRIDAITTILGTSENGNPNASAIPPVFDAWFHGDFRLTRPRNKASALTYKDLEEYPKNYPKWRMNSIIDIGIDTNNNRTIPSGGWKTKFNHNLSPITLEKEGFNPFRRIKALDVDGSSNTLPATRVGPLKKTEKVFVTSGGERVEGIRASQILGGKDTYLSIAKQKGFSLSQLLKRANLDLSVPEFLLLYYFRLPAFYTFVDTILMADGTRVTRLWDTSTYPAHDVYINGTRRLQNNMRRGIEWNQYGYKHPAFLKFGIDANSMGQTPFGRGSFLYKRFAWLRKPVDTEQSTGTKTTPEKVRSKYSSPMVP